MTNPAPTALVSWAHRNVGWSNAQAEEWTSKVVRFAVLLREHGVDAELDLWHESDTSIDWTRWGPEQVRGSEFVIIAVNAAWKQRWDGTNAPTVGAGVVAEADELKGLFGTDQQAFQRKAFVALLPGAFEVDIPFGLHRLLRSRVEELTPEGIEPVLRILNCSPVHARPPLGATPGLEDAIPGGEATLTQARARLGLTEASIETALADQELGRAVDDDLPGREGLRMRRDLDRGLLRGLGHAPASSPDLPWLPSDVLAPMSPSDEQSIVLSHPIDQHGVLLAGPGTGKSTTVLQLATHLASLAGSASVKTITFTRAATAELTSKIEAGGYALSVPTTVHSFALSVLMRHPTAALPTPLRIPDEWEMRSLIYPDLARRLRRTDPAADVRLVRKLINEMSAGWDSLDPDRILLVELDPALRTAFRGAWRGQQNVFGYSLFAEMTFAARNLLRDLPQPDLGGLKFLIVDEYQDLNRADIGMIEAVASHGVSILAVGDDDQSIYGFRHAAPQGIREFAASPSFPGARTYTLSVSHRLGRSILDAARELIESSPTRKQKPPLVAAPQNGPGELGYLQFANNQAEVAAVARMVKHLVEQRGVTPDQIVILTRSDVNRAWSTPLREALVQYGLPVVDVEAALAPLETDQARRLIALTRLMDGEDDLSWWTLLRLTTGIGDGFATVVADAALTDGVRFAERLCQLGDAPLPLGGGASTQATRLAGGLVEKVRSLRDRTSRLAPPDSAVGETWADWVLRFADTAGVEVDVDLAALLREAGVREPVDEGLQRFLGSLDRAARDVALEESAISLMTMSRSKGLTREATFVVGVEAGLVPRLDGDYEEERRLLYVAMTRARSYMFLNMARRRTGPTARSGNGTSGTGRTRSPFFGDSVLQPVNGERYLEDFLKRTSTADGQG